MSSTFPGPAQNLDASGESRERRDQFTVLIDRAIGVITAVAVLGTVTLVVRYFV